MICKVHESQTFDWHRHYSVLSFLLNGHLHSEYKQLQGMLGLPSCSERTWGAIVEKLEVKVTECAEWSCGRVRENVQLRGDKEKWTASFDGFYQTRGHYSNNSSSTLHDYTTGKIAFIGPSEG